MKELESCYVNILFTASTVFFFLLVTTDPKSSKETKKCNMT